MKKGSHQTQVKTKQEQRNEVEMNIREYLKTNTLIFDGAMGTYYAQLEKKPLVKCEMANIHDEEAILRIHHEYIRAGCMAIKTNTFGANVTCLDCPFEGVEEVIRKGYELARRAVAGSGVYLFADIGPIPFRDNENLFAEYQKIADLFLDLGAVNFLFETFSSAEYLAQIAAYIKEKSPQAFIITEFAVSPDGYTRQGNSGFQIFEELSGENSIDAIGFNCISGPYHLLQLAKKLEAKDKFVSIMPNAGYPTVIDNRTFFENNAGYFADQMLEMAKEGIAILGGCCGTAPEFIRKTAAKIKSLSLPEPAVKRIKITEGKPAAQAENPLMEKIRQGEKIIAVELDPPANTDIDFLMRSAQKLQENKVDAITIADCPIARARVDSSLLACKLKKELGVTPIPHMTCRDRNINATKALLLGLNIEGVNNVLVVTGDPIPSAQRDEVKARSNFNSAILANYIRTLNENTFARPFTIYGALNVNARNFEAQLKHARKKIENGVSVFLTQPILTKKALENLQEASRVLPAKILGGILPIVSYKNACFMNNEISGIDVSPEIMDLYENASKEQARNLAVDISTRMVREISAYVDGYYLITPFQRLDIVTDILENMLQSQAG
ncbi:homocysteine S-methyltransferase [Syntrophobotulus glycolicus DSM 8271]|uniref:Homocysteine S-methyltransferase n=2 Tax=Syntrophobotulus TaxID=51196 RepID=F0SZ11_SYNGF|nr:homocysteine S-methyltransferase [Syntrophobotulus glycolicus DSM 8271]